MDQNKRNISAREVTAYIKANKKVVYLPFIFAFCLAFLVYITSPDVYEVQVRFLPELPAGESNNILSQLGGAALLGGKSLGKSSGDLIDPAVYSEIVASTPFLYRFVESQIHHSELGTIPMRDFYREHKKDNLPTLLKKYTIQLPGRFKESTAMPAEEAKKEFIDAGKVQGSDETILNDLAKKLSVSYKPELGIVVFTVEFYDPAVAKQLAEEGTKAIIDFLVEYKSKKAARNLLFVEEQFADAQANFFKAQDDLAKFKDSNMNVWSASAKVREERLITEFNRTNTIYDNLSQQLEMAKLKVQEDTPLFSIIEPPLIPRKRSSPNGLLFLVGAVFLGAITSFSIIYIKVFIIDSF